MSATRVNGWTPVGAGRSLALSGSDAHKGARLWRGDADPTHASRSPPPAGGRPAGPPGPVKITTTTTASTSGTAAVSTPFSRHPVRLRRKGGGTRRRATAPCATVKRRSSRAGALRIRSTQDSKASWSQLRRAGGVSRKASSHRSREHGWRQKTPHVGPVADAMPTQPSSPAVTRATRLQSAEAEDRRPRCADRSVLGLSPQGIYGSHPSRGWSPEMNEGANDMAKAGAKRQRPRPVTT